jgi:hypothetical protein
MKDEYDFSKGERGKFYRPDAVFELPVYVEPDVARDLEMLAADAGTDVNRVLKRLIERERLALDAGAEGR